MTSASRWKFFRAGGFDQVKLDTGADLANLDSLDQKLWVALACPTSGLEIDRRTLELIDTDKDGRVRAPELIAAAKFATTFLKNPNDLLDGRAALALSAIKGGTPEGDTLLSAARRILKNLGRPEALSLSVEDLANPVGLFANAAFNGDGVITEGSATDEEDRSIIRHVIDCIGSEPDRSGAAGVALPQINEFFDELRAFSLWQEQATAVPQILALGRERTIRAAAAVSAIRGKIDDYFTRCRLAAFDPRIAQLLNRKEEEYLEVAARDLSLSASEVAGFPLAQVAASRPLPLTGAINPAHSGALDTFSRDAVAPILGDRDHLTDADWCQILAVLEPFEHWLASKQGARVEKLGAERVAEILSSGAEARLRALVEEDRALEGEVRTIEDVERLVRFHRDLYLLCTNFVNFRDFYDGSEPAVFQCGTLYLDQRACKLCLRVQDPSAHAAMAGLAGAYLAYAECRRPATGEKMHIVAVLTAGDSDNLMVGRNGLFYDRSGRDWDATITKIVDSPISIRQAFWSPYKKFVRLIEQQVAKRAASADSESHSSLATAASSSVNLDKDSPLALPKKIDVGSVAALGVAVGAIGTFATAMAGYVTGVLRLGIFATVGAGVGMLLLISTPSVVLAYITLRKRNLGPILDANGWAVNAKAKFNVAFGATLTSLAKLPVGAKTDLRERFVDRGLPWKRLVLLLLLLLLVYRWCDGSLDRFIPHHLRVKTFVGKFAADSRAVVPPPVGTERR